MAIIKPFPFESNFFKNFYQMPISQLAELIFFLNNRTTILFPINMVLFMILLLIINKRPVGLYSPLTAGIMTDFVIMTL